MGHHKGEIGHGRAVNRTAGTGSHDAGNLRHHAAGFDIPVKNLAIGRQRIHPFLNAGATGIVQADNGGAHTNRVIHDLADFLGMGLAQGSPDNREVLAEHEHFPAIDGTMSRDHPIAQKMLVATQGPAPSGF